MPTVDPYILRFCVVQERCAVSTVNSAVRFSFYLVGVSLLFEWLQEALHGHGQRSRLHCGMSSFKNAPAGEMPVSYGTQRSL